MEFTRADMESMAGKLDGLDLTEGEKSALVAVFQAAADQDEVSGFAYDLNPNDLNFRALVVERGFNIGMSPTQPRRPPGQQLGGDDQFL